MTPLQPATSQVLDQSRRGATIPAASPSRIRILKPPIPTTKKARIEGGTDEDQDRDETGKPTGMMEDTRITSSIDDEDMDRSGKPTDEVQRSDRNKNANGGSNKPR